MVELPSTDPFCSFRSRWRGWLGPTLLSALLLLSGTPRLPAEEPTQQEWIVISGGPALRFFEHGKADSHDKYWGNFIRAAVARLDQLKLQAEGKPGITITWLVYRPAYASRSREEKLDILSVIVEQANALKLPLYWFDTTGQLINYLNAGHDRKVIPIGALDYFGHSNRACLMFDYSTYFDNMSKGYLHEKDLRRIERKAFLRRAVVKSWGCHTGEDFSLWWKRRFGVPMVGAVGRTDYATASLPYLSKGAKWTQ
ncbi:hypothetical protein [Verrucomicrobium sp. 3C]|uniref:hypothetical protein n=1 Tax=Verrucomicrobium sp. 3C TaxID=1134055 RepID=UPI00037BC8AD|nr:hypothetical protein [Verrucomicrobium sp. 3C]